MNSLKMEDRSWKTVELEVKIANEVCFYELYFGSIY